MDDQIGELSGLAVMSSRRASIARVIELVAARRAHLTTVMGMS